MKFFWRGTTEPPEIEAATSSAEDPETTTPKSASERLEEVDKKTFLFAGYVFWALIFISGGATAAVLLSRKDPKPKAAPTVAPVPSVAPSVAPSYAECSHNDITEKIASVSDDDSSGCRFTNPVDGGDDDTGMIALYSCLIGGYGNPESADAIIHYYYIQIAGGFNVPHRFSSYLWDSGYTEFEFSKNGEPCNFFQADEFFENLRLARAIPCSHGEIEGKIISAFGESNCSTDNYVMGCELAMELGAKARANYSFSFIENKFQPTSLELTYSEAEMEPTFVDIQFSVDDHCTFDDVTSTVFEMIAGKCPEEKPEFGGPCIVEEDLRCQYSSSSFLYYCLDQKWVHNEPLPVLQVPGF